MAPFPSPAASAAGLEGRWEEEENIPELNVMKINTSALRADPIREQRVRLVPQELELLRWLRACSVAWWLFGRGRKDAWEAGETAWETMMDEVMLHDAGTMPADEAVLLDAKLQMVIKWCWSGRRGLEDGGSDLLGSSWRVCSAKLPPESRRGVGDCLGLSDMNF